MNRLVPVAAFVLGIFARRPIESALRALLREPRTERTSPAVDSSPGVARPAVAPPSQQPTRAAERQQNEKLRSWNLPPTLTAMLLAVAFSLAIYGQRGILASSVSALPVACYALGLLLFAYLNERARRVGSAAYEESGRATALIPDQPDLRLLRAQRRAQALLLAAAIMLALVTWTSMRGHAPDASYVVTAVTWLGSLAAAILATTSVGPVRMRAASTPLVKGEGGTVMFAGGAMVVALLARVIDLDHIPFVFGGDEGSQAMSAVAVLEGQLKNPFGTGWYSVPTLFFFLQAAAMSIVGDSVTGARTVPALMGVANVGLTFLLTRRLFGTITALIAALLLATFHYHVHFSRLSSIQIADSLAAVAVLYLLDRTLHERRSIDALAAGVAIGLSQYFSFAARLMPLVALAYVLLSLAADRWGSRGQQQKVPAFTVSSVAWIVLGAALAYAPLAAYFADHPDQLNLRTTQVSMFSSGWLEREMQMTGRGAVDLTINQIWRAVLLPFHTVPGGWYVNQRPFVGLPVAVLLALGLTLATFAFWRRPYRGLALAYWASAVGLGLTEDPTQTQRFVVVSALMCVLCAVAVTAAGRVGQNLWGASPGVLYSGVGLAVLGLMAWNLYDYFGPRDNRLYGDTNSLTATELAYYLQPLPAGTTAYFLGPPRMSYSGFQSIPFIARRVRGIDVPAPFTDASPRPQVTGPTVFAALPERARELELVRQWFPGGEQREIRQGREDVILVIYALLYG